MSSADDYVLGVDVGGTGIATTGFYSDGRPFLGERFVEGESRADKGPVATVRSTLDTCRVLMAQQGLDARGLRAIVSTAPAPADPSGVIRKAPNLRHPDWSNCAYRDQLRIAASEAFGHEILAELINDVNAAGQWEASLRPAVENLVMIAPGTGFGGALVVNQRVVVGKRGIAAELGHFRVDYEPFRGTEHAQCGCGQFKCIESMVSLAALRRILSRYPLSTGHPLLAVPLEPDKSWIRRALAVRDIASEGDWLCRDLFIWQAGAIGALCAQIAVAYDPEVIVIGGGWLEVVDDLQQLLLREIRRVFELRCSFDRSKEITIEPAQSGDWASCLGAGSYALTLLN